jgi:phospholipase C
MDRIDHWIVLMFENRSFDNLLGHLPHIPASAGLRDQHIELPYPAGTVTVGPTEDFHAPIPDPGEAYGSINVQLYGRYDPPSNAERQPYAQMPDYFEAPYNAPRSGDEPTMDGAALDFYNVFRWEKEREPTSEEMQTIGGVFTPRTAPVINTLAEEYAVFTRWFCEAPTCTTPNRNFFLCGTNAGRLDNQFIVNYGWDFELPSIFTLFEDNGLPWAAYADPSQKIPMAALSLGGIRHRTLWKTHTRTRAQFFQDCAEGTLPAFSWVEPCMLFGELDDYHPPTDIRTGEAFLAAVYNAVRSSPAWESTALLVLFDEAGGCFDHVPPPAATPDGYDSSEGFMFDRFGLRVPSILVSAYTERSTVVTENFHHTAFLRSMRERFDLGPALTPRDASAPLLTPAFNRDTPRTDALDRIAPPSLEGVDRTRGTAPGDNPDAALLKAKATELVHEKVSRLGAVVIDNLARLTGRSAAEIPQGHEATAAWAAARTEELHGS